MFRSSMHFRYSRIIMNVTKSVLDCNNSVSIAGGGAGGCANTDVVNDDKSNDFQRKSVNQRNNRFCPFFNISMNSGEKMGNSHGHHHHHHHHHGSTVNSFKVFLILESYLNVCYFLFLVPFRFSKNHRGVYHVKTNILQQIVSTLLILTITVFSLLDLRHYQKQQNVRERPDQTFKYATIFLIHWIPVCWIIVFWLRQSRFSNLLSVSQSRFLSTSTSTNESDTTVNLNTMPGGGRGEPSSFLTSRLYNWTVALKVAIFLTATKNTLFFYNEISMNNSASLENYMDSVTERFLYDFGLESSLNRADNPIILIPIGYMAAVIHFLLEFLIYMFDQLCLTAASMTFATCQHFLDEFRNLVGRRRRHSGWGNNNGDGVPAHSITSPPIITEQCLKKISTVYLDLLALLSAINLIFGPCMVMFFMYLYPLFIWSVFDSVQNNSLIENLIRVHDIGMLCCVTGIAAEASSKVEQFRQWLFEAAMTNLAAGDEEDGGGGNAGGNTNEILLRFATMHREVSSEPVGLKGYKFFTVTYRFVATMIGVVITYAIVMFQFVMDPRKTYNGTESQPGLLNSTTPDVCTC